MDSTKKKTNEKKIILTVIGVIIALIICLSIAVALLERLEGSRENEQTSGELNFSFCPIDYELNIFDDPEYAAIMNSDFIRFKDNASNLITGITKDSVYSYGEDIEFMMDYVYSIIEGDYNKYNSFFSEFYYEDNASKDRFTMQKLDDILITRYSSEEMVSENGNYTKYIIMLDYRIIDNNGSFRRDITTGSKTQTFVITDKSGHLLIDELYTN